MELGTFVDDIRLPKYAVLLVVSCASDKEFRCQLTCAVQWGI